VLAAIDCGFALTAECRPPLVGRADALGQARAIEALCAAAEGAERSGVALG
jgi:hypothetical protein